MKKHASFYWLSLISLTTAAVCVALPSNALADDPPPAVAATVGVAPGTANLPYGVQEVIKMHQGGISKDVILRYVENSTLPMHLNADGIIYLQHLGLPQEVMSAMLTRDGQLQKEAGAAYQQQMAATTAAANANAQAQFNSAPPPVVQPSGPAPQVAPYPYTVPAPAPAPAPDVDVYPDYYPYYGYPYYSPLVIGGGWGWGWGHGYYGGWHGGGFGRGGFHGGHR